jgi:peptidoglycan lytic transglycosylase G
MLRFAVFLVLAVIVCAGLFIWERANFAAPGPAAQQTVVLIAPGDGVAAISQKLADAQVIRNALLFEWGVRLRGEASQLKAGEYAIPAHASLAEVAAILIFGNVIQHKFTAAEGLTSGMIFALVESDPELVGNAGPVPPEGTLLPETYLFTHGTTRAAIISRMQRAQRKFLNANWDARAPDLPFGTPEKAVILASIVEKETALPDERRHIAAVFVNRLRRGMKLQSDPTIIYGLTRGYPLGHGIRASEVAHATPYNTYAIDGLPPTPICNPGKDSIAAVLAPQPSNDLYFVADGAGGHVFSDRLADHTRNVAKWRQIEKGHP